VADDSRLLARDSTKGYVDFPGRAMRGGPHGADVEPEAIGEEEQQRISDEARRRWQVLKGEELARKQTRSRLGRLRQVEQRARTKRVDIFRFTSEVDRQINLAEQLVDGVVIDGASG
jgi:hypothetical protein